MSFPLGSCVFSSCTTATPSQRNEKKWKKEEENGTDDNWKKGGKSRPDIYDDERKERKVLSPTQKKRDNFLIFSKRFF
jgi:hypothetical protein